MEHIVLTALNQGAIHAQISAAAPFYCAVIVPGWFGEQPFMEAEPAIWDAALAQNFEAMIYGGQAAAKHLIASGNGGRIIYVSSVAALKSLRNMSVLGTSLAALHAVARMAAVDLAAYGITVNVIATGWQESHGASSALDSSRPLADTIPAGRLLSADDVCGLCTFLISAEYITGAVIPLDGGYQLTKTGAATQREIAESPSPSRSSQIMGKEHPEGEGLPNRSDSLPLYTGEGLGLGVLDFVLS